MLQEHIDIIIGMLDHQMYIERLGGRLCDVFHIIKTHGKVRNISSVHDIYMKIVHSG